MLFLGDNCQIDPTGQEAEYENPVGGSPLKDNKKTYSSLSGVTEKTKKGKTISYRNFGKV
jgi:hypothetical protein